VVDVPRRGNLMEIAMRKHLTSVAVVVAIAGMLPALAIAHVGHGDAGGGLWAGMLHPVSGLDHIAAMVALGIWAAQLGAPAIWLLPIAFPLVVALGGALGALGVPIPGVEVGIALSAITFGLMIALSVRAPRRNATSALLGLLVASFAIFHGYAHGAEIPESANAMSYAVGFVLATGLLHALGIVLGVAKRWAAGGAVLRITGFSIALFGVYILIPNLASV
jgi:urease accessory protein